MTPSQPRPPAQPSAPSSQIRSRITVVCAECKRLKLKCDRRAPCGSCTKRDTVARCIYSPAAAEKVDLHSLNNRLMQVEAALSLITSGQTPPVFQSSYPFSQIPADSNLSSSNAPAPAPAQVDSQHHCHHHPPTSSLSSLQELSSIWLDELERNNAPPLELRLDSLSSNEVKVETTLDSKFPQPPSVVANDSINSQGITGHSLLPSPRIYYPSASSERYPPQQPPSAASSSQAHGQSEAVSSKPSVTPALVNLLPTVARAKQLLQGAVRLFYVRPVPFPACLLSSLSDESGAVDVSDGSRVHGKKAHISSLAIRWDAFELRALCLIGNRGSNCGALSVKSDRREREKISARAREIFFGSTVSSTPITEPLTRSWVQREAPKGDPEAEYDAAERERPAKGRGESLPFFATVCMVLAIGAAGSKISEKERMQTPGRMLGQEMESPEFFHALAQQSLDVWEKNMTVSPSSGDDIGTSKADCASEEEKLDYLVASLLGVGYQLYESHLKTESKDEQQRRNSLSKLLPLVAKIMNMARVFGLGNTPKSSLICKDEGLGRNKDNPRKDNRKRGKVWERRRRKDDLERLIWWDVVFYELFISDVLGHSSLLSTSSYPVELPRYAGPPLLVEENDSGQEDSEENWVIVGDHENDFPDIVEKYHGARCCLTRITQMVKHKLAHPNCCCGYTLDQAAGLEAEVSRFLEDLPLPLRFTANEDEYKGGADEFEKAVLQAQRCTLAIMTQRLIIMAYLPFLRSYSTLPSSFTTSSNSSPHSSYAEDVGKKSSGTKWNPVLQPILSAAQCIIRASLQLSICKADQSSRHVLPLLLELYPVEKAVLDAVIICTYISTSRSPLIASWKAEDSAVSGMRMLWDLDLGSECKELFYRLKKRYHVIPDHISTHGVKRKHEQIIAPGDGGYDSEPQIQDTYNISGGDASASQALKDQLTTHQQQWPQKRAPHDISAGSVPSVDNAAGKDLETAQKGRKHAKKSHPSVGIRLRQGKTHFLLRHMMDPSSGSTSNIGMDNHQELELRSFIPSPVGESQQQPNSQTKITLQQQTPQMDHNLPGVPLRNSLYRSRTASQEDLHTHLQNSPQAMTFAEPRMNGDAPFDTHKESSPALHPRPYEGNGEHERQRPSLSPTYLQGIPPATAQSSRYGSGHPSPTGSLSYATNATVMPTPTPSFVRAPQAAIPHQGTSTYAHAYYPMGSFGVNDPHNHTHGQGNVSYTGVRLDTASGLSPSIMDGSPIDTGMAATVPSPPVYEKARSAMYDVKETMDGLVQEQLHHHHHLLQHQTAYNIDQPQRHQMSMTQAWPPQTPITIDGPQRFWIPPTEDFKYFQ